MELRDNRGHRIGVINKLSSGKLEARNAKGVACGTYDPKSNETRDSRGRLVGKGDLLASLVAPAEEPEQTNSELRDARGRLIGKITKLSSGRFEIRNSKGVACGTYDPKTDETRDAKGRRVGSGNQLSRLITVQE